MKIAIVAPSGVPYAVGGAEKLWWGMLDAFRQYTDHEVELIKIPSPERNFRELISSYETFSQLDLNHFELVISTKYPAWMINHWNHYVYLQHTLRGLYDTYPTEMPIEFNNTAEILASLLLLLNEEPSREKIAPLFSELKHLSLAVPEPEWQRWFGLPSPLVRKIIHWLDSAALKPGEVNKYMAISENVKSRIDYFPKGVEVRVIHHPSDLIIDSALHDNDDRRGNYEMQGNDLPSRHPGTGSEAGMTYDPGSKAPTLFTASRLDAPKRVDLIINAVKATKANIKLRIAGSGPEEEALRTLAGDDTRIKFLGRITDAQIKEEYARALCVPFVPADEDYGLITVEAMQAGKPVLSTADAGGVGELVNPGSGWLVEPTPMALASVIEQLADKPHIATAMRDACLAAVAHINWPDTLEALLAEPGRIDNFGFSEKGKPNEIVVAVSFPVYPPQSGGQNRVYHLYKNIARSTPVTLVTLCNAEQAAFEGEIAPGLREIRIPKSTEHQAAERELEQELQASIGDIFAIEHMHLSPDYLSALCQAASRSKLVIASHPYLYPAIRQVYRGLVFYDSHNVEYDMKADVLAASANADRWLALVKQTEQSCCEGSVGIAVCSAQDQQRLQGLYRQASPDIAVIANGVDSQHIPWVSPENRLRSRWRLPGQRPSAIFMGSWHGPNIEAVSFIINTLAPQCRAIDFLIIGSVCGYFHDHSAVDNVKLLGLLSESDKNDVLSTAQVAINPMNSGAGSNLKMAEYACAGLPVISTPWGLRGLGFTDGQHVFSAELQDFSKKLQFVVNQTEQGALNTMIVAAKSLAVEQHDWRLIADDFYRHIVSVCHFL